ncbi:hypothetical protein NQD34_007380 [Periophthalmus magnuspinnatus]|nr:hypothetical protein NQD34_007380 [Periophthalmus magnuspinnatus]
MFSFERIWTEMFRSNPPSPEDEAEESIKQLNINASVFIIRFNKHYQSMLESVQSCGRMSERVKLHRYTLKACVGLSVLLGVLTIVVAVAVALDQGTFAIEIMSVFAIGFPFVVILMLWEERQKSMTIARSSIEDFRRKVSLLNPKLEKVKRVCEELRRSSWSVLGGTERVNIMRLEQSVLEVFVLTEGLSMSVSPDSVTQVYEEYRKTLSELDKMKVQLNYYTGTAIILASECQ